MRSRTLSLVAALLFLLILLLYFPLRGILLANSLDLEKRLVSTNANRASEAISARVEALGRTTLSYSSWDDTYKYALGELPDYPAINHSADTLTAEDRDLVLISDTAGKLLFQRAFDLEAGAELAPADLANPADEPDLLLVPDPNVELRSGLLWDNRGLALINAAPILRSDGSGPPAGVLVFGRHISPTRIDAPDTALSLSVELFQATSPDLPADVATALTNLSPNASALVQALDQETVASYSLLDDIYGQPTILMRTLEPRTIYAQGRTNAFYLALALVVAVLIVGGTILLLLEHLVLARVSRISQQLDTIRQSSDSAARLSIEGDDELNGLANAFNATLAALDRAENARRAEAEERLRLQGEVIEAERQLISRVSHELRTPLTPIKGFVDLLLLNNDRTLSTMQLEVLQIVRGNTERMIGLVDELLEIERAQSGRLELKLGSVALPAVVESTLTLLRAEAERKQLTITTTLDECPPIEADQRRLEQIMVNLVSNSVKYTPAGGAIEVAVQQRPAGFVTISVRDNGIGMTPEQQKKLFTPFFRADTPLHNANNGSGLGLLITRMLVELHKGRIDVQSSFSEGSTFSVILPLAQANDGVR